MGKTIVSLEFTHLVKPFPSQKSRSFFNHFQFSFSFFSLFCAVFSRFSPFNEQIVENYEIRQFKPYFFFHIPEKRFFFLGIFLPL